MESERWTGLSRRISKLDGSDVSKPKFETLNWTFKTPTTGLRAFSVQFEFSNFGFETSDPSNFEVSSREPLGHSFVFELLSRALRITAFRLSVGRPLARPAFGERQQFYDHEMSRSPAVGIDLRGCVPSSITARFDRVTGLD
jgi:hypothetical protein